MSQERILRTQPTQLPGYEVTQQSGLTRAHATPQSAQVPVPAELAALTSPTSRTESGIHLVTAAAPATPSILIAERTPQKSRLKEENKSGEKETIHYSTRWEFYKEVAQKTGLTVISPCLQTIETNEKRIRMWSDLTNALMSSNETTFQQGLNLLQVISLGTDISTHNLRSAWLGFLKSSEDSYIREKVKQHAERMHISYEDIPEIHRKPQLTDFVERPQASARALSSLLDFEEVLQTFAARSRVIDLGKNNGEQTVRQTSVVDSYFTEIIETVAVFEQDPQIIEMHLQRIKLLISVFCHTIETLALPDLRSTLTALQKLADKLPVKKKVTLSKEATPHEKEYNSFISYPTLWDIFLLLRCDSPVIIDKVLEGMKRHGDIKHPLAVSYLSQLDAESPALQEQSRLKEELLQLCTGNPNDVLDRFEQVQRLQWQLATVHPKGTGTDLVGFDCEVWPFNNMHVPWYTHIALDGGGTILELKLDKSLPVLRYDHTWINTAILCRNWQYLAQAPAASIHLHIDPPESDYQRKLRVFKNLFGTTLYGATSDFWVNDFYNAANGKGMTFEVRTSLELYPVHEVKEGATSFTDGFNSFALINFMLDAQAAPLSDACTSIRPDLLERDDQLFARFRHIVRLYEDPTVRLSALLLIHDHFGPRLRGHTAWNEEHYNDLLNQELKMPVPFVEDEEESEPLLFIPRQHTNDKNTEREFEEGATSEHEVHEEHPIRTEEFVNRDRMQQEAAVRRTQKMITRLAAARSELQNDDSEVLFTTYAQVIINNSSTDISWDAVFDSLNLTEQKKNKLIAAIFSDTDIFSLKIGIIRWFLSAVSDASIVPWSLITKMAQNYAAYTERDYYLVLTEACDQSIWREHVSSVLDIFEKQLPSYMNQMERYSISLILDVFVHRLSDTDFYTPENRYRVKLLLQQAYTSFKFEYDSYHVRNHVYKLIDKFSSLSTKQFPELSGEFVLDEVGFTTSVLELFEVLNYNVYALSLPIERILELPLSQDNKFLILYTYFTHFVTGTEEENNNAGYALRSIVDLWNFTGKQIDQLSDAFAHRVSVLQLEDTELYVFSERYCKPYERKNTISVNLLEEVQARDNSLLYLINYAHALFVQEETTVEDAVAIAVAAFNHDAQHNRSFGIACMEMFLEKLIAYVSENPKYVRLIEELFILFCAPILKDPRTSSASLFFNAVRTVGDLHFSAVVETALLPHVAQLVRNPLTSQGIMVQLSKYKGTFSFHMPEFLRQYMWETINSGKPVTAQARELLYQIREPQDNKLDLLPSQIATLKSKQSTS